MKQVFVVTILAVIVLTGILFETQASAQYQYPNQPQYQGQGKGQFPGRGGQFMGTSTPVNGSTYTNSNFGVTVSIPSGWSGMEMKRNTGSANVMLAPGGFQFTQGGQRPPVTISLSLNPLNQGQNFRGGFGNRGMDMSSCTNSTTQKTINSLIFNEIVIQCTGTNTMKFQTDRTQTSSASISLGLRADSSTDFDAQNAAFQSMLSSLQITGSSTSSSSGQGSSTAGVPSSTTPAVLIPGWVKKNAGYWASGSVGDSEFVSGVQYMVQNGIMKIPPPTSSAGTTTPSDQIPSWVKKNAGFWSSGQLNDDDFVKGIQYLISNHIIKVA